MYLDVSMDMPVTVEMSLERVLSPVNGVEFISNVQVKHFCNQKRYNNPANLAPRLWEMKRQPPYSIDYN